MSDIYLPTSHWEQVECHRKDLCNLATSLGRQCSLSWYVDTDFDHIHLKYMKSLTKITYMFTVKIFWIVIYNFIYIIQKSKLNLICLSIFSHVIAMKIQISCNWWSFSVLIKLQRCNRREKKIMALHGAWGSGLWSQEVDKNRSHLNVTNEKRSG